MIHGDPIVNVLVINGRPMWVFNFKLTLAILVLRVCKPGWETYRDLSGC